MRASATASASPRRHATPTANAATSAAAAAVESFAKEAESSSARESVVVVDRSAAQAASAPARRICSATSRAKTRGWSLRASGCAPGEAARTDRRRRGARGERLGRRRRPRRRIRRRRRTSRRTRRCPRRVRGRARGRARAPPRRRGELADVVESASGGFRLGASAGTRTRAAIAGGDARRISSWSDARCAAVRHGSHVATTAWHISSPHGSKPDHANAGSERRAAAASARGTLDGGRRGLAGATRGTPRGVILVVPKRHPTNQRQGVQHVAGRPRLAQRDRGGAVKRSHRIGTRTRGAHRAVCSTDDARGVSAHEPSATSARGALQ